MDIKLAVGLPFSGRYLAPEWAQALATITYPMGCSRVVMSVKGFPTDIARTLLVKKAQKIGTEYIFFLDEDTAPPQDVLLQLMQVLDTSPENIVACGGIYVTRSKSAEPLVFAKCGAGAFWKWKFGDVFPCWGLGTGCMLIRTSVFSKLPEPWFKTVHSRDEAEPEQLKVGDRESDVFEMTEDMFFCDKLDKHGFKILAHGGVLPVHCGENGQYFVLAPNSYPVRDVAAEKIWYHQFTKQKLTQ